MSNPFADLVVPDTTSRMTIMHPFNGQPLRDAEGNEAWIDLLHLHGTIGRGHDREVTDRNIRPGAAPVTTEMAQADFSEKLARITKGWRLLTIDGALMEIECTPAACRFLYADDGPTWLRSQVVNYASSLANFRRPSSTS